MAAHPSQAKQRLLDVMGAICGHARAATVSVPQYETWPAIIPSGDEVLATL